MPDTVAIDTAAALALWQRLAPDNSKRLLDARDERQRLQDRDDKSLAAASLLYWWDGYAMRYRLTDGRTVKPQAVVQAVNTFAARVENQLAAVSSRLIDKTLMPAEWRAVMTQRVATAHTAAHAAAVGGVERVPGTGADETVGYHTKRLEGFFRDVDRGGLSPEAIIQRSRLYGVSIPGTFEEAQYGAFKRLSDATGVQVETFNVLDNRAQHCSPTPNLPSCIEETDKGWVPLGLMTRPGQRACGPGCRCYLRYRQVQD